jgi:aspartyl-tRNA(Asn)/glutamyl-tRNA(Gln) amidotransferase subunit A
MIETLADAAAALASGATTSVALTEAALARAADKAGEGARVFTHLAPAQALATAAAQDALRAAGRAASRFAGIPITIKDLFDVAGEVTSAGSTVLRSEPPATRTAHAIARLFSAGMVPVGRTNMTEFAFSGLGLNPHYGSPRAPWERSRGHIAGGSSSGGAVSVSDRMGFGAIGTDTGGSCRIPAACCGITGFKPTAKRIPQDGVLALSPTLDSVGALAADVTGCEILDAIMAGELYAPLPARPAKTLRLLLVQGFVLDHMDVPTESSIDRAVRKLAASGVTLVARELLSLENIVQANGNGGFASAEAFALHRHRLKKSAAAYDPRVAARIEAGGRMSATDYAELIWAREKIIAGFEAEMLGFDAIIMPTIPVRPPRIAELADDDAYRRANFLLLRNPSLINFLNGCAISLPCHEEGAPPAGLMIAAPAMQDKMLFAIARGIEALLRSG